MYSIPAEPYQLHLVLGKVNYQFPFLFKKKNIKLRLQRGIIYMDLCQTERYNRKSNLIIYLHV